LENSINITSSTETLEPVPINSGWRGDHQPLDDGVTPVDLIEKYKKVRSITLELWKPMEVEDCRALSEDT
jgi:hypothetical protein